MNDQTDSRAGQALQLLSAAECCDEEPAIDSLRRVLVEAQAKFAPSKAHVSKPACEEPTEHVFDKRADRYIPKSVMDARRARNRARNTPTQRQCRDRKRAQMASDAVAMAADTAKTLAGLQMQPASSAALKQATAALVAWFKVGGKRQKLMRADSRRYALAQRVLLHMRHETGIDPQPAEFAQSFNARLPREAPIDRMNARNLLKQLAAIEAETGPWDVVTPPDEGSPEVVTSGDEGSKQVVTVRDEGSSAMTPSDEGSKQVVTPPDEGSSHVF